MRCMLRRMRLTIDVMTEIISSHSILFHIRMVAVSLLLQLSHIVRRGDNRIRHQYLVGIIVVQTGSIRRKAIVSEIGMLLLLLLLLLILLLLLRLLRNLLRSKAVHPKRVQIKAAELIVHLCAKPNKSTQGLLLYDKTATNKTCRTPRIVVLWSVVGVPNKYQCFDALYRRYSCCLSRVAYKRKLASSGIPILDEKSRGKNTPEIIETKT